MSVLIKNGTIATAADLYTGDVLVEGERISTIGTSLTMPADRVIDASGKLRAAGRHRRSHPPRHAVRRIEISRRLRVGHDCGSVRRHDVDRRFRDPVQGTDAAPRLGDVDAEGRGQGRDRLRLPHDRDRSDRPGRERDGRARAPGRHLVQALHGLSRRVHARRREHLQSAAENGQERRHDLHARREWRRHRRAREKGARRGQDCAEVSRADATAASGSGGHAPGDRARRDCRRSHLHRPPLGRRGAGDGHRSTRPRPACIRGDLPAVPVPLLRQLRRTRFRRREICDEPAAAARRRRRIVSGGGWRSTTSRRSRPITVRSA